MLRSITTLRTGMGSRIVLRLIGLVLGASLGEMGGGGGGDGMGWDGINPVLGWDGMGWDGMGFFPSWGGLD